VRGSLNDLEESVHRQRINVDPARVGLAMIVVIVPAAGTGTRFGGELSKQFQLLAGKPVLEHVVERFLGEEVVGRVVVALPEAPPIEIAARERLALIRGGQTRQQSVIRALSQSTDAEIIMVHDAVRPLFSPDLFRAVLEAAREIGAALPVIPVADTIHELGDDGTVRRTLDRSRLGAAQTPQCFRAGLLRDILSRAERERIEGTDEAGLAVRFGHRVRAVPGEARNLKITLPEDLALAEAYLRQGSSP
jgi:2-C-methyl-D-erythritol 4-phosphate cytidylyltransferase